MRWLHLPALQLKLWDRPAVDYRQTQGLTDQGAADYRTSKHSRRALDLTDRAEPQLKEAVVVVVTPSPLVVPAVATRTQGIGVCSAVLSHVSEVLSTGR